MISRSGVDGSLASACGAAQDLLEEGATALEAAVGGYFAAALEHPGVLLGAASLIVGQGSNTLLCFDGRLRQPGRGAKRPRGFRPVDSIPPEARVAIPRAPQALLIALSHFGPLRLSRVFKPVLRSAGQCAARRRSAVLERAMEVGARAFQEDAFVRPLVQRASPSVGGLVTSRDFSLGDEMLPLPPRRGAAVASFERYELPWSSSAEENLPRATPRAVERQYLLTGDARGLLAGLEFEVVSEGVAIEELELLAPLSATPVLRGVTRSAPGTPVTFEVSASVGCDEQSQAHRVACTHRSATHALLCDPPTRQVRVESAFGRALRHGQSDGRS